MVLTSLESLDDVTIQMMMIIKIYSIVTINRIMFFLYFQTHVITTTTVDIIATVIFFLVN